VRLIFCARLNPAFQQLHLISGQLAVGMGRRHLLLRIIRAEPFKKRTLGGIMRRDGAGSDRALPHIQPQIGHPSFRILSMAMKAVFRQNGPDIAVELRRWIICGYVCAKQTREDETATQVSHAVCTPV